MQKQERIGKKMMLSAEKKAESIHLRGYPEGLQGNFSGIAEVWRCILLDGMFVNAWKAQALDFAWTGIVFMKPKTTMNNEKHS